MTPASTPRVSDASLRETLIHWPVHVLSPTQSHAIALDLADARIRIAELEAKCDEAAMSARTAFDAGHAFGMALGIGFAGGPQAEAYLKGDVVCASAEESDRRWAEWNAKSKGAPATVRLISERDMLRTIAADLAAALRARIAPHPWMPQSVEGQALAAYDRAAVVEQPAKCEP
jgi:hypothetical protein